MPRSSTRRRNRSPLVFERRNYILLAIGVALVALGFALMSIENEFLGTISLYVAPVIILSGYAEIVYAILWRRGTSAEEEGSEGNAEPTSTESSKSVA